MVKMMVDLSAMRWVACKDGREPISRNFSAFVGLTKFLGLRLEVYGRVVRDAQFHGIIS